MKKRDPLPSRGEWAGAMAGAIGVNLDTQQRDLLGQSLDAAYRFDMTIWKAATAVKSTYRPENHGNDWCDLQQTMYLCNPTTFVMTADAPLKRKVSESQQADRVLLLRFYLQQHNLSL